MRVSVSVSVRGREGICILNTVRSRARVRKGPCLPKTALHREPIVGPLLHVQNVRLPGEGQG